jgi:KDO2-lipid IV(A) lauroyltransferase
MSLIVFSFMWLVHFLPLGMQAWVGSVIGRGLFWLIPERRKVTRINLAKCFPQKTNDEREALARAHFSAFTRAFIEQGNLWWSSRERIREMVQLEGLENL